MEKYFQAKRHDKIAVIFLESSVQNLKKDNTLSFICTLQNNKFIPIQMLLCKADNKYHAYLSNFRGCHVR